MLKFSGAHSCCVAISVLSKKKKKVDCDSVFVLYIVRSLLFIPKNNSLSKSRVKSSSIYMGDNKICDISNEVLEELKKFRFRKSKTNSALILKIDREKQSVVLDEFIDDITVDELQDSLPGHQPRYLIYTYKMVHEDQRISYPMCFIFYTPRDSQIELQMMYACTKSALQREVDLTRVYEVRELDELTEEWLRAKLK